MVWKNEEEIIEGALAFLRIGFSQQKSELKKKNVKTP